jgi:hypothetical protein
MSEKNESAIYSGFKLNILRSGMIKISKASRCDSPPCFKIVPQLGQNFFSLIIAVCG